MSGVLSDLTGTGGLLSKLDPIGKAITDIGGDPLGLYHAKPGTPGPMSSPEQLALNSAQPYLAEYQSGQLDPANQAAVNQADTNATSAALQSFANAGILDSTSRFATTGNVKGGQAGASSAIDVGKATQTQGILQQDLNIGLDYLGIASGDANAQMALQVAQNQQIASDLQTASQSLGQIYGSYQQNQVAAQTGGTGGGYDPFVS